MIAAFWQEVKDQYGTIHCNCPHPVETSREGSDIKLDEGQEQLVFSSGFWLVNGQR